MYNKRRAKVQNGLIVSMLTNKTVQNNIRIIHSYTAGIPI